jgi:hypothetical protein
MASWTVKPGDTLWSIWQENLQEHGVSWADFQELNSDLDFGYGSIINVGDSVNIGSSVPEDIVDSIPDMSPDDTDTGTDDTLSINAREELLSDPAYASFMASFGMDLATTEATLQSTYERLLAGSTRSFGQWGGPMYQEDDPSTPENEALYGVMEEGELREATKEELLDPSLRSGGQYDIQYGRLMEDSQNLYGGKGMAFGGGAKKANVRLMEERDLGKLDLQQASLEGYQGAQMLQRKEKEALIRRKLKEEQEAAERLSLDTV